jgi:sugar lactone lactonase YvrE
MARVGVALLALVTMTSTWRPALHAQSDTKSLPNPYRLIENWPTLPRSMNGGKWGELIRVAFDPKGNLWVFHRCFNTEPFGRATCVGRSEPPILQFDPSGTLLRSFGQGIFAFPHGFTVDHEGNIWASDANGQATVLGMSTGGRGHQVFKFSPEGKLLLTLGKKGVAGNGPDTFDQPTGIAVARNGDIFVTDGHGTNDRVVKFSKDGRFIKTWGKTGSAPGEFNQPHDICIDSHGRVYVADRSNRRIQIFDQEGNFIDQWKQFGGPSAIFVSKDGVVYASDSMSNSKNNPGRQRGIFIGRARDGSLTAFIPDPEPEKQETVFISGASGITADEMGNVYAADVGPKRLRKYVKVSQ